MTTKLPMIVPNPHACEIYNQKLQTEVKLNTKINKIHPENTVKSATKVKKYIKDQHASLEVYENKPQNQ